MLEITAKGACADSGNCHLLLPSVIPAWGTCCPTGGEKAQPWAEGNT